MDSNVVPERGPSFFVTLKGLSASVIRALGEHHLPLRQPCFRHAAPGRHLTQGEDVVTRASKYFDMPLSLL